MLRQVWLGQEPSRDSFEAQIRLLVVRFSEAGKGS